MDIQVKIGLRIKEIRTQLNLTQEAIAFRADVDRTFMNHIENGRRNISVSTLNKIVSNGLEMTIHDFFDNEIFNGKKKGKK